MLFDCRGRRIEDSLKTDFHITLPGGEVVYTEPGRYGPGDMIIKTQFPSNPHAHTLKYIGTVVRLKALVEDRRYAYNKNGEGRRLLNRFLYRCSCPGVAVASTDIGIVEEIYDTEFGKR